MTSALRRRPFLVDSLLVAVLLLAAAFEYRYPGDDGHHAGAFALNFPLTVVGIVPLAWRRRAPVVTYLVGYAAVIVPSLFVAHTLFAYSGSLPSAFFLATVARHCNRRVARWALLGPPLLVLAYDIHVPQARDAQDLITAIFVYGVAWIAGRGLRRASERKAALDQALADLTREQEQRQRLAVLNERARLARELHDVVAHAVALMLVQAGAARLALDTDVDAFHEGVLAVERIGREATADLRRLLGLMRADAPGDILQSAPGVGDIRTLADQMTDAGLEVELNMTGPPPQLSPSLDLSVYRVLQEALTNVLKHAGPTNVRVLLDYTGPIGIDVVDAGPRTQRPTPAPSGHGLVGMRERVALFGGRVTAQPQGPGFAVHIELPLPEAAP
jgi:signal transduction histidine kinase